MTSDQEPTVVHSGAEFPDGGIQYIRKTLLQNHYDGKIDAVLSQLEFNIVIMGSSRVGKSQLINALCENSSLAETSASLDSCTAKVKKYVMDSYQLQAEELPPTKINIFDTPGVESWKDEEGEQTILNLIKESNPICVIFCAAPGCFSPLKSLRFLLQYCQEKHIICATVCTNMWSSNKRNDVIAEFKKELQIFGPERGVYFLQNHLPKPHLVTFFGNGALCTMVNSIEYVDDELEFRRPVQGVDELINGIMELLDDTKLLGWCITVLGRRSFWEKISQGTTGFFQMRLQELKSSIQDNVTFKNESDSFGISIQASKYYSSSHEKNVTTAAVTHLRPISNKKLDILIACLNVDSTLISSATDYSVKPFSDACTCVSQLVSLTDRRIYFIVSKSVGKYVTPIIHQSQCVEQIYIYCANDTELDSSWTTQFSKIRGSWNNSNLLCNAIRSDLQSITFESPSWTNIELLQRFHRQTLSDSSNQSHISLDTSEIEKYIDSQEQIRLVILHCDNEKLFCINSQRYPFLEYSNVMECENYFKENDEKSIFFIISGQVESVTRNLILIDISKTVHAIYLLVPATDTEELNQTILIYTNIGRLFHDLQSLLTCLTSDIEFYIQQQLYIPMQLIFSCQEAENIKSKVVFSDSQEKFVIHQMFIQVLQEIPLPIILDKTLIDCCRTLVKNKSDADYVKKLLETDQKQLFDWFVNNPFLSVVINTFLIKEFPQNLLTMKDLIVAIDKHFIINSTATTPCSTVYRAQLIRTDDLKLIRANTKELISFLTYMVVSKNLMTTRTIARQAADRGLLAVMFQFELPAEAHIVELSEERLMLGFGTIFRIQSVNLGSDNVWYCLLKYDHSDFQQIQKQLQAHVGESLNWLTLGNYLCVLDKANVGKIYFETLLKGPEKNHQALPSIYNNLGLIYAQLGDHEKAFHYYKIAMDLLQKNSSWTDSNKDASRNKLDSDRIIQSEENKKALECYRKALKVVTDPLTLFEYELKIRDIISSNK